MKFRLSRLAQILGKCPSALTLAIEKKQAPYEFAGTFIDNDRVVICLDTGLYPVDLCGIHRADLREAFRLTARQNYTYLISLSRPHFDSFLIDMSGNYHRSPASIYILFDGADIVYFGQTTDGIKRMGQHKSLGKIFDKVLFIPLTPEDNPLKLEGILIRSMQTKYNRCNIARTCFEID